MKRRRFQHLEHRVIVVVVVHSFGRLRRAAPRRAGGELKSCDPGKTGSNITGTKGNAAMDVCSSYTEACSSGMSTMCKLALVHLDLLGNIVLDYSVIMVDIMVFEG